VVGPSVTSFGSYRTADEWEKKGRHRHTTIKMSVVLISGCSDGGIGWYLAQEFAKSGCIVYASARNPSKVSGLKNCEVVQLDVTSTGSIEQCVKEIIDKEGKIDILVNNGGIGMIGPAFEVSKEGRQRIFDTNVFGLLDLTKEVAKHMMPRGKGLIANVGSIVGTQSTPWGGAYSASKFAVHAFTQSMRMELAPFGINVTLILPGAIRSNIGNNNMATNIDIPTDTLFSQFIEAIKRRAMISQQEDSTPTDEFAKVVVKKLLSSSPPRDIWYGRNSTLFWVVSFFPGWMVDWLLARTFKLTPNSVKPIKSE
jgi:1-acylglycerone phosphate reductase